MDVDLKRSIVAVISLHPDRVRGGAPVFIARNEEELDQIALFVAKTTRGMVHDLNNGTYIIVKQ